MEKDPLFLVFIDLRNSYNTVDRRHLLINLEGYGAISCMCILLALFWYQQEFVTCQNAYHGPYFKAT